MRRRGCQIRPNWGLGKLEIGFDRDQACEGVLHPAFWRANEAVCQKKGPIQTLVVQTLVVQLLVVQLLVVQLLVVQLLVVQLFQ